MEPPLLLPLIDAAIGMKDETIAPLASALVRARRAGSGRRGVIMSGLQHSIGATSA
jgi:hypothetical protein